MNYKTAIFSCLSVAFLFFSLTLYINHPAQKMAGDKAAEGKLVWQKYNCQSCHQLYGLGGYLGPDLTNILSEKGKGPDYVLALIRSGVKQMPSFRLSHDEERLLIEFLRQADNSGTADPRAFEATTTGMIHAK